MMVAPGAATPLSLLDPFRLDQRVAVVTGGASGIGLASARLLAHAGAMVVLLDRDHDRAAAATSSLQSRGFHASFVLADVADAVAVEQAFREISETQGRLDVLVNCAGIAIRRAALELPLSDWEKVVAVNMTGSFLTSRAAARCMIAGGRGGAIVQTASIMGLSGGGLYPNISYQTTKGAIVNMTRALAIEWAGLGIRVNAIAPTYVRTPFIQSLLDQPELVARIKDVTPLHRIADPEDIAPAVLYLASPASAMVTGHTLPIDGGFLAQ